MPKYSDAGIGDTVLLRGKVVTGRGLCLPDNRFIYPNANQEVEEIISKTWEPKVGDQFFLDNGNDNGIPTYTIEGIRSEHWWVSYPSFTSRKRNFISVCIPKNPIQIL